MICGTYILFGPHALSLDSVNWYNLNAKPVFIYSLFLKIKSRTKSSPKNEKYLDIQTTPIILQTDQSYTQLYSLGQ